ncbi:MAG: hypothetical protein IT376_06110 [Polyangiaceae bacterium]|nr:hypothetical protein [Polyangiaceae bacterium]
MTRASHRVGARLVWEHTHRELLPAVLLLHELERRGRPWVLEHVSALGDEPADREVLFLPFYYDDLVRDRYLSRGAVAGRWLVNLAYEQVHFRCGRRYLLPDGAFAREQMLHCAWGERFRTLLLEHGIPAERIRLTGQPRFDVYHHPELLLGREDLAARYRLDAARPWLLVPFNFNLAYITPDLRQSLVARGYDLRDEFLEGFGRARDAFLALVRRLADELPEHEVILRVHPAGYEAEQLYRGETRTRPNLHLIAHYDIANWITQSALTIVWNSTSSMEAMVAGRPVVSYEPFPFSERFDFDVNRILTTVRTEDDVLALARGAPDRELGYDWQLFESWYQHRDGRIHARLADVVDEAAGNYERFASRGPVASTRRLALGRRLERLVGDGRLRRQALRSLFGVVNPRPHAPPPAGPLRHAVRSLDPSGMLAYLE